MADDPGFYFARVPPPAEPVSPLSTDPLTYRVYAEITDEDTLFALAKRGMQLDQYQALQAQAQALAEQMDLALADLRATDARVFYTLRRAYPDVVAGSDKQGFRKHGDTYYFVGWREADARRAPRGQ